MADLLVAPGAHPSVLPDGTYENRALQSNGGFFKMLGIMWKFFFAKPRNTRPPAAIPVLALTPALLQAAPDRTAYRLGHSSLLLKLRGQYWLTDPVFSERASPVSFAGPKRFHAPPIAINHLPLIHVVLLSHDHYDHLDEAAIRKLTPRVERFIVPRGVAAILQNWGVPPERITELVWWQQTEVDGVRLVATPTQHFSGRGLLNRNRTLWCSWVIADDDLRIFYGADSGYFSGFRQIGEQFGPFDVTFLECGAYNENWPGVHMQPEQTVQAHLDLRGQLLVPIHNGTFDLALHPWDEPFERVTAEAQRRGVPIGTPQMGASLSLSSAQSATPAQETPWWRSVGTARQA